MAFLVMILEEDSILLEEELVGLEVDEFTLKICLSTSLVQPLVVVVDQECEELEEGDLGDSDLEVIHNRR